MIDNCKDKEECEIYLKGRKQTRFFYLLVVLIILAVLDYYFNPNSKLGVGFLSFLTTIIGGMS